MNRIAISDLTDGLQLEQAFRAADKQLRVNRQGGKYILMRLADRSGVIAGMFWNADEHIFESFDRGDYIFCRCRTQIHNGALQVIVSNIERMDPSEVDAADFERYDHAESDRLLERLQQMIGGFKNVSLRKLGEAYLADAELMRQLQKSAAAVNNHHAYPGGLIRHTVDLMDLAALIGPRYPEIDTELLMMGAFLHDSGKIEELAGDGEIAYTDRGQLVGHIVIGIQMLGEKMTLLASQGDPIPEELRYQLEHLIVSHHGQLEFGSPKLPVTLEAVALHHLDNLDAKLASYVSVMESDVSADGNWTNYNPSIGRKLWKK
ncbi:MAG: OB-fold nucleic acid binding domain-containing protein [Rubripirellula sp.]|nr:OB-fold nucleic acid binding domain-containing protein [Rubripirellula sp.]